MGYQWSRRNLQAIVIVQELKAVVVDRKRESGMGF